jgi:uncharacterized membrane protein (UPF0127 family)
MPGSVRHACLGLTLLVAVASACANESDNGPRVVVQTANGEASVSVELADTPAERSFGLMYRKDLAADAGMLFIFDDMQDRNFWMKNTPLPLDMIFIDARGEIVGVVADTTPFTTTSRRHGVRAGDRVRFEDVPGVTLNSG